MKTTSLFFGFILFLLSSTSLFGMAQFEAVTPEVRLQAAAKHLEGKSDYLAIYAKGFVCNSCGIGLRIHLSKLDLIDKSVFKKGVLMDASKQLLILALQPNRAIEIKALQRAVDRAGYEASHYYRWTKNGVVISEFPKSN